MTLQFPVATIIIIYAYIVFGERARSVFSTRHLGRRWPGCDLAEMMENSPVLTLLRGENRSFEVNRQVNHDDVDSEGTQSVGRP